MSKTSKPKLTPSHHLMAFNKKIINVETSAFQTVNFDTDPSLVLCSGILTACCVLVIKQWDEKREKYGGVVTMAHIYPSNTHSLIDKDFAVKNLQKIINDFEKKGGELNDKTSIQLFCGLAREADPRLYNLGQPTEREIISSAIIKLKLNETCKYKEHETSISKDEEIGQVVFVDQCGTQIIREKGEGYELITPASSSPLNLRDLTHISLDIIYNTASNPFLSLEMDRSNAIVANASTGNGLEIASMETVHKQKCRKLKLTPEPSLTANNTDKLSPRGIGSNKAQ